MMHSFRFLFALALGATAALAWGGQAIDDKRADHLFRPTPRELLREMSTDRPDKTESPFTVDAGHFQVEMDLAAYSRDRHTPERDGTKIESWSFGATNLKFGLRHNVDFQIVLEPFSSVEVRGPDGTRTRHNGFGDLTLRTKINLWGNDGGATALAVMPFIKLPTNQDDLGNHAVEGGLIVPFAVNLADRWGLGLMTEVDLIEDADGSGHHLEWVNTITVGYDLTDRWGMYVEFASTVSAEPHTPWIGTLDIGFTYAITEDVQLDGGVNLGLTRAADDVNPFVGLSWRF
jgi:hypothetical protein